MRRKKERKKDTASKKEPALVLHNLIICIYTLHQRKKERKKERKVNDMHIYIALRKERRKRKKEEKERKKTACAISEDSESDQSFRCLNEESLGPYLPTEHTSKTMT